MITFSSGLHFGVIVTMIFVVMLFAYEVFNVLRLAYAEYKYNKTNRVQIVKPNADMLNQAYEVVWGDSKW